MLKEGVAQWGVEINYFKLELGTLTPKPTPFRTIPTKCAESSPEGYTPPNAPEPSCSFAPPSYEESVLQNVGPSAPADVSPADPVVAVPIAGAPTATLTAYNIDGNIVYLPFDAAKIERIDN